MTILIGMVAVLWIACGICFPMLFARVNRERAARLRLQEELDAILPKLLPTIRADMGLYHKDLEQRVKKLEFAGRLEVRVKDEKLVRPRNWRDTLKAVEEAEQNANR